MLKLKLGSNTGSDTLTSDLETRFHLWCVVYELVELAVEM